MIGSCPKSAGGMRGEREKGLCIEIDRETRSYTKKLEAVVLALDVF